MSVNDPRGPSVDSLTTKTKNRSSEAGERLAHRGCNTKKGAIAAVVPWPPQLFIVDPAPILASADRLHRKGGRVVMARCPTASDAQATADWLVDRLSRLTPALSVRSTVEQGGGQYLVVLQA